MSQSDYLENAVLDKTFRNVNYVVSNVFASLHDGFPFDTGAGEVSGGSYARVSSSWNAASGGNLTNSADIVWSGLPATTLLAVGFWDASSGGNFLGFGWLGSGGFVPFVFSAVDVAGDVIVCPNHPYILDDRVVFDAEVAGSLPNGISNSVVYWIINPSAHQFRISTTQGGVAVNYTTVGSGFVTQVQPIPVGAGESFRVLVGSAVVRLF